MKTSKMFITIVTALAMASCNNDKEFANYKPQNKMFYFCKTFCSKITLVNTIQNVILNTI